MPKKKVRQKRALIQYRQTLVKRRTQIKNNIRAILEKECVVTAKGKSGWTKGVVAELRKVALSMDECDAGNLWRGQLFVELEMLESVGGSIDKVEASLDGLAKRDKQIQRLQRVSGIGPRLAEAVVAFIDEPSRFRSGKQVGSYAGLTPRQYQSGSMDHQGKISGQGNKVLRSLLVEVCWLGLRHNKWMRETYERILRGSVSRKKIAITAVARKLLIRCWAMLRDEKDWRDGHVRSAA